MKASRLTPRLLAISGILIISGCSSVPDEVKGYTAVPEEAPQRVITDPARYRGQPVRIGGKVVGIQNLQQRTRLVVAVLPLDSDAKPQLDKQSVGRIVVYVPRVLEPTDYRNRLVTVMGAVSGEEVGQIGAGRYRFVVVNATGLKRWNVVNEVILPPPPGPVWTYNGWHYPGWGGWYDATPGRVETVVKD